MAPSSRGESLYSIGVLPALMGLGHLAPAIGAIHATTDEYQYSWPLFGMIGTAAALVDSYDTYKDIPLESRPRRWVWKTWIYALWGIVFLCTFYCGFETATRMYRFSLIGLLWGTPCVPVYEKARMALFKPKTVFREAKSLVVATCMGIVTADTSTFHFCHSPSPSVSYGGGGVHARALALAILYQFLRETICDVRDMAEDLAERIPTLPVRLGKANTLLLLTAVGVVADAALTGAVRLAAASLDDFHDSGLAAVAVDGRNMTHSMLRIGATMAFFAIALRYPREESRVWGLVALFGLVPCLSAQAAL